MKKISFLKLLICAYIIYCLIFYFDIIKYEINSAIEMWIKIIVPSVFPYLVISRYISDADILSGSKNIAVKLLSKLFGISYCSVKAIVSSLICGYPSGAICALSLYKNSLITKDEAKRLICFTNNAGPLFLISAVGICLLGSVYDGCALYVIQLISAFIYGIASKKNNMTYLADKKAMKKNASDLCTYISQSVVTIVNICGFMIFAYVMSSCVMIAIKMCRIDFINENYLYIFIKGFFEISAGVKQASLFCDNDFGFAIICSIVSWSGVSVIMQIKSASENIISFKHLIKAKFIQAIISFVLGYAYSLLFDIKKQGLQSDIYIKISIIISAFMFLVYIIKNKKRCKI